MLTREQILSRKPKRLVVEVPEWDGAVTIQEMTIGASQAFAHSEDNQDHIVALVIASVINEDGSMMFSPEDEEAVKRLNFAGITRLAGAINEFNGYTAKAVEAAAKNSEPGLNGDSSSA